MKAKKLFKILAVALSAVIMTSTIGCNTMDNKNVYGIDFSVSASTDGVPTYDSADKFILGAWLSPDPRPELWQWYKESGLNEVTIFPACAESKDYLEYALKQCKELGIDAQILIRNQTSRFNKSWKDLLAGYEDVVTGFDIWDEPYGYAEYGSSDTARPDFNGMLANGIPYVQQNFPGKSYTSTLWPNYANKSQLAMPEGQGYNDYVKLFCDKILTNVPNGTRKWIGTDFYAYYTSRFDGGLLNNLEVLQYYGGQYGADVYLYIQTQNSSQWRAPNRQEMALQYYTALAYGVKNLQMYCYQMPAGGQSSGVPPVEHYAMITDGHSKRTDENGQTYKNPYERTHMYYSVQALNAEVTALAKAYMDFKWKGVLTSLGTVNGSRDDFSGLSYTLTSYDGVISYASTENMIIGCFEDGNGNDGFMITNYSNPVDLKEAKVDIDFGEKTRAIVYKNGVKYVVNLIDGHYKTTINGGDGHFVIPVE